MRQREGDRGIKRESETEREGYKNSKREGERVWEREKE